MSSVLASLPVFSFSHKKLKRRFEIPVQESADHDNVHTGIEPEHQNDNGGKASICAETVEPVHIDGKKPGNDAPPH